MTTMQWQPEINAMTTPQSYWIRFMPRNVVGKADMAARMPSIGSCVVGTFCDATTAPASSTSMSCTSPLR